MSNKPEEISMSDVPEENPMGDTPEENPVSDTPEEKSLSDKPEEKSLSDKPEESQQLSNWKTVAEFASRIAVIVGVVLSLLQLSQFVDNAKRASQAAKLSVLREVRVFLAEDEDIRRKGQHFLHDQLPKILPVIRERVADAGSGEAFYLSKDMEDFAAVHYHYEQLGALVKLGYVDMPLVFEVIAFPDAYMNAIEPIRAEIAKNWKGPDDGLSDLGSNIHFLERCYAKSRKDDKKVPSCPDAGADDASASGNAGIGQPAK